MAEYFTEQYKTGKPLTVVTHAGDTVTISPDTVLQHINNLKRSVYKAIGVQGEFLSGDCERYGLSNAVAEAVGSDARYHYYPQLSKIALNIPTIKVDDHAPSALPNGVTPEYHYSPYIPLACIMRAIHYPTGRSIDVLRYASRFVDRQLGDIPARGAPEKYINWLAVECQVRLGRSFDSIKSSLNLYPVETFRDLSAIDMHMLLTEVNKTPGQFDYESPINRIDGYPDLALRVVSANQLKYHYELCTATAVKLYIKDRDHFKANFYNDLIRLIVRTDLVCEFDMRKFLRDCDILFQDVNYLAKLGRIAERLHAEKHGRPSI